MAERSKYLLGADGKPLRRIGSSMPAPYESGGNGRRLRGWHAPGTGPTDVAVGNAQTLRNRSRSQYRNNAYGLAGINRLVSNIVGTGIKPRSLAESKAFQAAAQRLWEQWTKISDPEGLLSFYGQQAQACNTWLQAGEAFVRMRPRREADGLPVPLQLQVMEPEMCPLHHSGFNGGNIIRHGIEFNPIGQRVAYWFYRQHPGDAIWRRADSQQLTRVPAREVVHLFDPVRPGQIRGVVKMAPVLLRMHDVDKYDDAVLLRQQLANLFAAFITRKSDEVDDDEANPLTGQPLDQPDAAIPEIGLEPGTVNELGEGEDIRFASPPDAGSTYGDFLYQQLLGEAAGMEVPYEVMTGDFSRVNDRTARILLNEFRRRVQQWQHHIVIHQLSRRVWEEWWMPRAVLAGALDAPGYADNAEAYRRAKYIPQAWAYHHPLQDAQAYKELRLAGFRTRGGIINETTGEDIDDVDAEFAAENARADNLGLKFTSDARYATAATRRPAAAGPDDEDDAQ